MTESADLEWISPPSGPVPLSLGSQRLTIEPPPQYPAGIINITNRCNLRCKHCYLYAAGNPSDQNDQIPDEELLAEVERIRDRHGLLMMVWQGGEPMIRWRLLERAVKLFAKNTITTNGTIPLKDFGPTVTYVVSLDGPEEMNDALRGEGVYGKARATIDAVAPDFSSTIQVQCVITKQNQRHLEELVTDILRSRVDGMTFSFYCPNYGEDSPLAWADAAEREEAVDAVLALKIKYPHFIWNSRRAMELMRPATAKLVTDNCPALKTVMPLYVENGKITSPFCCHGNKLDCDLCGTWVAFAHAAKIPGPWDEVLPPTEPYGPLADHLDGRAKLDVRDYVTRRTPILA
jgi:MoaA/NifB/PqqE/SkfB family radical SAM enzyme